MTTAKEKTDWLRSRISGLTHSCQPGLQLLIPFRLLVAPCRSSIAGCSFAVEFWSEIISLRWSRNPSFRSLGRVALANSTASRRCSVEQTAIDCSQVDRLVLPSSDPCTSCHFDRAFLRFIARWCGYQPARPAASIETPNLLHLRPSNLVKTESMNTLLLLLLSDRYSIAVPVQLVSKTACHPSSLTKRGLELWHVRVAKDHIYITSTSNTSRSQHNPDPLPQHCRMCMSKAVYRHPVIF